MVVTSSFLRDTYSLVVRVPRLKIRRPLAWILIPSEKKWCLNCEYYFLALFLPLTFNFIFHLTLKFRMYCGEFPDTQLNVPKWMSVFYSGIVGFWCVLFCCISYWCGNVQHFLLHCNTTRKVYFRREKAEQSSKLKEW